MSKLIFDAMIAWNQLGMLAGGAIIGGLGALLLGSQMHWRLRALRVSGTLIGVRETRAHVYAPVYRYVLPNGVAQEGTSDVGSSSVSRLRTGASARLMVFAQHPDTVALADSYVSEILGGAFVAVAGVLIYIAMTAWPLTPITWLVLAAVVIYTAIRWRKAMPGKGVRPRANPVSTMAGTVADGGAALGAKRLLQIEQITTDPATIAQQRKQQRLLRYLLPITAAVGIALLVIGVREFDATSELQSDGQRSRGTIVGLEVSSGSHSSSYHPVVEFRTAEDALVRFRDRVGSNPPSHQIGDAVTVLYLREAPQPSAIIDRGYWNWLPALALGLFGPLLSAVSLRVWLRSRNT